MLLADASRTDVSGPNREGASLNIEGRFINLSIVAFALVTFTPAAAIATPLPSDSCVIMPSSQMPILKWCETEDEFVYEISTWNETYTFAKSALLDESRLVVQKFLKQRCEIPELRYDSGQLQIWITVPRSGAELAAPRLGIQMSSSIDPSKKLQLIFANAWNEDWSASLENLYILGARPYDDFSGESLVGLTPGSLLLRPLSETNGQIAEQTVRRLQELGVRVSRRIPGSLPIYQAESAIFKETQSIAAVKNSPVFLESLKWIEANSRVEALGDKFLLYSEALPDSAELCPAGKQ